MTDTTTAKPLTVDRQSWHYKLVMHIRYKEPKDLCSYFWTGVGNMVLLAAAYFFGTVAGYLVAAAFLSPFVTYGVQAYLGFPLVQTFFSYAMGQATATGAIIWWFHFIPSFFVYGFGAVIGYMAWTDTDSGIAWAESREATAHLGLRGLIREQWKAFKGSYCPLLEMKGESDRDW